MSYDYLGLQGNCSFLSTDRFCERIYRQMFSCERVSKGCHGKPQLTLLFETNCILAFNLSNCLSTVLSISTGMLLPGYIFQPMCTMVEMYPSHHGDEKDLLPLRCSFLIQVGNTVLHCPSVGINTRSNSFLLLTNRQRTPVLMVSCKHIYSC